MIGIYVLSLMVMTVYGCREQLDLVFLIDGSNNVSPSDFIQQKAFVSSQTMEYSVSPHTVNIAVMLYSGVVWETIKFKESENEDDFISQISSMKQQFGNLIINNALTSLRQLFRSEGRPGAKRVAVLLTTGRSSRLWEAFREARQLPKEHIILYAIGIGPQVSRSELIGLTSDRNTVLIVDTFNSLFSLSSRLHEQICPGYQKNLIKKQPEDSMFSLLKPHVELSIFNTIDNKGLLSLLPQRTNLIDNNTKKTTDIQVNSVKPVRTKTHVKNVQTSGKGSKNPIKRQEFIPKTRKSSVTSKNSNLKQRKAEANKKHISVDTIPAFKADKVSRNDSSRQINKTKDLSPAGTLLWSKMESMINHTGLKHSIKKNKIRGKSRVATSTKNQIDDNKRKNIFHNSQEGTYKGSKSLPNVQKFGRRNTNALVQWESVPNRENTFMDNVRTPERPQTFNMTIMEAPKLSGRENFHEPEYKIKSATVWDTLLNNIDLNQVKSDRDSKGLSVKTIQRTIRKKGDNSFSDHKNYINVEMQGKSAKRLKESSILDLDKILSRDPQLKKDVHSYKVEVNGTKHTMRNSKNELANKAVIGSDYNPLHIKRPSFSRQFDRMSWALLRTPSTPTKVTVQTTSATLTTSTTQTTTPNPTTASSTMSTTQTTTPLPSTFLPILSKPSPKKPTSNIRSHPKYQSTEGRSKTTKLSLKHLFSGRKGRPVKMNTQSKSSKNNLLFYDQPRDIKKQVAYLLDFLMLEHDRMVHRKKKRKDKKRKKKRNKEKVKIFTTRAPIVTTVTPSVIWEKINIKKDKDEQFDQLTEPKRFKKKEPSDNWKYRRPSIFLPGNEARRQLLSKLSESDKKYSQMVSEHEHCNLLPFERDISFYLEPTENRTVLRPCPEGTAFDIKSCACDIRTTVRGQTECLPEILLDFETDTQDKSGKNIHVGSNLVELSEGSALFNGKSDLTIWRFTGSDIGHKLTLNARFKTMKHPKIRQYVISNCQNGGDMSYAIEIDRFKEVVIFTLDTEPRDPKEIKLPFELDKWTDVSMMYDGLKFTAMVNDQIKSLPLAGNVETRSNPLRIGGCGGKTNGFYGLIDEISLSFCTPRQRRRNRLA